MKLYISIILQLTLLTICLAGCGGSSDTNIYINGEDLKGYQSHQNNSNHSNTGNITGTVVDSQTGIGIANAIIQTNPSVGTFTTDYSGNFIIDDVKVGTYTITAIADDFNKNSLSIYVKADKTISATVVLVSAGGSFSRNVLPIFKINCAIAGCHDDSSAAASLCLTNYQNIYKGSASGAVINPYDSSTSMIIKRIKGTMTPKMPLYGLSLSVSDQSLIANWISGGAINN